MSIIRLRLLKKLTDETKFYTKWCRNTHSEALTNKYTVERWQDVAICAENCRCDESIFQNEKYQENLKYYSRKQF